MKQIFLFLCLVLLLLQQTTLGAVTQMSNQPDSAYIFSYSTKSSGGHNGLHFAWSIDRKNWNAIGPEFRYLFCDYGRWGTGKRLVDPFLWIT